MRKRESNNYLMRSRRESILLNEEKIDMKNKYADGRIKKNILQQSRQRL